MNGVSLSCYHCGAAIPRGAAHGGVWLAAEGLDVVLCHTGTLPPQADPPDCYRLVTVYHEELGSRMQEEPGE